METKPFLAVFVLLSISVGGDSPPPCTDAEKKQVNDCLFAFVVAHHSHRDELVAAKYCKLSLLDCSELDTAYKCLNKAGLSDSCTDSLETTINKYIADLPINCTVSQFNSHCPDATRIAHTAKAISTPAGTSSSETRRTTTTHLFLYAFLFLLFCC